MDRPDHLPDFSDPPLNEVVLGVQFAALNGFGSLNLRDVYDLFRADFPKVQEHPALDPVFETFGGVQAQPSVQFHFGPVSSRTRLWFISDDNSHLIQFQIDRLLLNWRRQASGIVYPRFEGIFPVLASALAKLSDWVAIRLGDQLKINQVEVSYINVVPVGDFSEAAAWFKFIDLSGLNVEGANTMFAETLRDETGRPHARFTHELLTVSTSQDGKAKAFRLTLTVRGAPLNGGCDAALDFIKTGRDRIVTRFGQLTTDQAHEIWGRLK